MLGGAHICDAGANRLIETYLHDCIYSVRDAVGFAFGMASICFWLVAQLPQFMLNIKTQSVDALSSWFLAQWLLGDTCNLVGCLLTESQLPTQTYTAMYFIIADMVMMIQYVYYGALQRRRERIYARRMLRQQRHLHHMYDADILSPTATQGNRSSDEEVGLVGSNTSSGHLQSPGVRPGGGSKQRGITRVFASLAAFALLHQTFAGGGMGTINNTITGSTGRSLLQHSSGFMGSRQPSWARRLSGQWLGYISSVFYLSSRTSQIYKNFMRGRTEGLSVAMFLMAISANVSYGLGVLIRSYSWADVVSSGPWLIGSLGVVALDVIISVQVWCYPQNDGSNKLRQPLLIVTPAGGEAYPSLTQDNRRGD